MPWCANATVAVCLAHLQATNRWPHGWLKNELYQLDLKVYSRTPRSLSRPWHICVNKTVQHINNNVWLGNYNNFIQRVFQRKENTATKHIKVFWKIVFLMHFVISFHQIDINNVQIPTKQPTIIWWEKYNLDIASVPSQNHCNKTHINIGKNSTD